MVKRRQHTCRPRKGGHWESPSFTSHVVLIFNHDIGVRLNPDTGWLQSIASWLERARKAGRKTELPYIRVLVALEAGAGALTRRPAWQPRTRFRVSKLELGGPAEILGGPTRFDLCNKMPVCTTRTCCKIFPGWMAYTAAKQTSYRSG